MTARHFETVTKTFSEMAFYLAQCNVYLLKLCDHLGREKEKTREFPSSSDRCHNAKGNNTPDLCLT